MKNKFPIYARVSYWGLIKINSESMIADTYIQYFKNIESLCVNYFYSIKDNTVNHPEYKVISKREFYSELKQVNEYFKIKIAIK